MPGIGSDDIYDYIEEYFPDLTEELQDDLFNNYVEMAELGFYDFTEDGLGEFLESDDPFMTNYEAVEDYDLSGLEIRIGADFPGIGAIVSYEDDRIYIPTSNACAIKCYQKYFEEIGILFRPSLKKLDLFHQCPRALYRIIKEAGIEESKTPKLYKKKRGEERLVPIKQTGRTESSACILLYPLIEIEKNGKKQRLQSAKHDVLYHAVLIKDKKEIQNYREIMEHVRSNLKFGIVKEMSDDWIQVRAEIKKAPPSYDFVVWDIEAHSVFSENGKVSKLIPWAVGWGYVKNNRYDNQAFIVEGDDCIEQFLEAVCTEFGDKEVQLFAHNGGNFDSLYIKRGNGFRPIDQIGNGKKIKVLKGTYKDHKTSLIFKDSILFTQMSLEKSGESFKIPDEYKKKDFDIKGKSKQWYQEHSESTDPETNWKEYLRYDVHSLAYVCIKFNDMIQEFGFSINQSAGVPGLVWSIMTGKCMHLRRTYRTKDPVVDAFFRAACYGGRILHWQKEFNSKVSKSEMIALDGTSLYPSAMALGEYPVGQGRVENDFTLEKLREKQMTGKLFIAEIEFSTPNIRYPIHPYRTDKGAVIYCCGDKLRGVYTSVDIEEMEHDGYVINQSFRGVWWTKKAKIFENIITELFERRKALKAEKNDAEVVFKIVLNSAYGKFLEKIESAKVFRPKEDPNPRHGKLHNQCDLGNGWIEATRKFDHPHSKKPSHIGAFILSYSRKIMNNYIRKLRPENIWYGDTDSLYTTRAALAKSGIVEFDGLGGVKNDYKDLFITEAVFLDIKRYLLKFNNGEYKIKFTGLTFINKKKNGNDPQFYVSNSPSDPGKDLMLVDGYEKAHEIFKSFLLDPSKALEVMQEVWRRDAECARIDKKAIKYIVNPEVRGNWLEFAGKGKPLPGYPNAFTPIGADINAPRMELSKEVTYFNQSRVATVLPHPNGYEVNSVPSYPGPHRFADPKKFDMEKINAHVATKSGAIRRVSKGKRICDSKFGGMTHFDQSDEPVIGIVKSLNPEVLDKLGQSHSPIDEIGRELIERKLAFSAGKNGVHAGEDGEEVGEDEEGSVMSEEAGYISE